MLAEVALAVNPGDHASAIAPDRLLGVAIAPDRRRGVASVPEEANEHLYLAAVPWQLAPLSLSRLESDGEGGGQEGDQGHGDQAQLDQLIHVRLEPGGYGQHHGPVQSVACVQNK